ncbi:hypothetical protein K432DRAFT_421915 [Lepidopterella palustris CBS 459.81]|uniref:Chromo domain-containing protein n=1 Tax=Lepidopterella palustris CBS 459.81 TaxID=1314670 RepID=A0A8E2JK28_9PEZI|nr:hypothetical protein K432DRAFT_421915 [Lepidopterella palustris CBS 459.81]
MATTKHSISRDESDSDSISVTSTAPSIEQPEYAVEEIRAERETEEGEMEYLIKWEGYPLHRCTWEPQAHLLDKQIEDAWKDQQKRARRGYITPFKTLEQFNQHQIRAFEKAQDKAELAKLQRRARRRAKRIKKGLAVETDDEGSEEGNEMLDANLSADDAPVPSRSWNRSGRTVAGFVVEEDEQEDDEMENDTLFMDERPRVSPQPLSDDSDDSFMSELVQQRAGKHHKRNNQPRSQTQEHLAEEQSSKDDPPTSKKLVIKSTEYVRRLPADRDPQLSADTPLKNRATHNDINVARSAQSISAATSVTGAKKSAPTTMKRTPAGITLNMGNSDTQKRRWKTGSGTFKTMKMVRKAELRGRNERAPDLQALQFVNRACTTVKGVNTSVVDQSSNNSSNAIAQPATKEIASTTSQKPSNYNPYSLRGIDHPSRNESVSKPEDASGRDQNDLESEITPADADKVPMTCFSWKNGSCFYNAESCKFLHRLTDLTSSPDGSVPPKFQRPPLTCFFWFNNHCRHSDEDCWFAHWNTGLLAGKGLGLGQPRPIDKTLRPPIAAKAQERNASPPQSVTYPTKELTCWYWSKGYCRKPENECSFAHRQTGKVANPPPTFKGSREVPPESERGAHFQEFTRPMQECSYPIQESNQNPQYPVPPLPSSSIPPPPQPPPPPPAAPHAQLATSSNCPVDPSPFTFAMTSTSSIVSTQDVDIPDAIILRLVLPSDGGSGNSELRVRLARLDKSARERLHSAMHNNFHFEVKYACQPGDWKEFIARDESLSDQTIGDIIPLSESALDVERYADFLKMDSSGGVICNTEFTMVIFPTQQDRWDFLRKDGQPIYSHLCKLRFHIIGPIPQPLTSDLTAASLELSTSAIYVKHMFRVNLGVDPDRIFAWLDGKQCERKVFLMFDPDEHGEELEMVTRFLQEEQAEVYHSGIPGSWELFRTFKSGVVMFHPDIYQYWKIPGLRSTLIHSFNHFQLGCNPFASEDSLDYECTRLFPLGNVVFITDDVFAHQPSSAFSVVKAFDEKFKNGPQVLKNSKLAGRPGLISWALELMEEHEQAILSGDKIAQSRVYLYERLSALVPPELEDPFDPPNPSEEALLLSVSPQELPHHHALWQKDEIQATETMVEWFAGWACTQATNYRRFIVVHVTKRLDWLDRYNHLVDVVTSDECIRKFYSSKN